LPLGAWLGKMVAVGQVLISDDCPFWHTWNLLASVAWGTRSKSALPVQSAAGVGGATHEAGLFARDTQVPVAEL